MTEQFRTYSYIVFNHYRNENMLDTVSGEFSVGATSDLGTLQPVGIKQIIISKEAQKEYVPYGNQKSYYLPTGMIGPVVKLICAVGHHEDWEEVYSNDYLTIVNFDFPTWSWTLTTGTSWWVDSISLDARPGARVGDHLRYEMTLDLYKRTVA